MFRPRCSLKNSANSHGRLETRVSAIDSAPQYLSRSQLAFSTHIVAGELLFTILDTAELLGCHEIVLPALRHGPWRRRFAGALARKLARATRSATVLLADTDGMSGPPPA